MTNGEKIRQMTDEQLAKLIEPKPECGKCPFQNSKGCSSGNCMKAIIEWLKQDAIDN